MEAVTWMRIFSIFAVALAFSAVPFHSMKEDVFLASFNYDKPLTDDQFRKDVSFVISKLPVNEETGRKGLILFVTNAGMVKLTKNAICSLWFTNVPKDRIVVLALDEISYASLQNFGVTTLYYPYKTSIGAISPTENSNEFLDIVKAKFKTISIFIDNGTDVAVSDSDVIYTQNPFLILSLDTEIEACIESAIDQTIPRKDPFFWGVNLGFYHLGSSPLMKKFIKLWEAKIETSEGLEAGALWEVVKSMSVKPVGDDTLIIKARILESDESLNEMKLRYINPLFGIQAIGPLKGERRNFIKAAKTTNLSAPYWCHFNGLGSSQAKEDIMRDYQLWYMDAEDKCLSRPPQGNSWPWWRK